MGIDAGRFAAYESLSSVSGDLVGELHPDGTLLHATSNLLRLLGLSPGALEGASLLDPVHPDDRESIARLLGMAVAGESPTAARARFVLHDAREVLLDCRFGGLTADDGTPRVVFVGRDVTAAVQRERALDEREEAARLLVDHSTDVLWVMDAKLNTRYMSPGVERQLGYTVEEYLAIPMEQRMPPESVAVVRRRLHEELPIAVEKARRGEPHHYTFEALHRHKDGREAWGEVTVTFLNDGHGNITGFHGVTRNIDARKCMEAELEASREQYRRLFEGLLNGCVIVRVLTREGGDADDLYCETVNPAFERHSGLRRDQVEGRRMSDVFGQFDPFWLGLFDRVARTGEPERIDRFMAGVQRHIEGVVFPLDEARVAGLFEDVTQRRRIEDEAMRVQRLESIGVLAGGIAHDFNNILTGILGNISLCRERLGEASEPAGMLRAAEKACGRARDLTQQLLTFSRGGDPVKQDASLPDLVRETSTFALSGSNVRADLAFTEDVGCVAVDRGQFARVVHNLVLNAAQSMPDGGVVTLRGDRIRLGACEVAMLPAGDYVRLSVRDQGPGIPPELLGRVFDPYFTTRKEGTGLGLPVADSIARKHGGALTVSSEPGQGSTFTVFLPFDRGPGTQDCDEVPGRKDAGQGRVLVMDDDEDVREVLSRMLAALGYEVIPTGDGEEAVARYRELQDQGRTVVAVIMDLTVPGGMGGRDAMRALLRLDPGVRGIVISGYSNDPVMSRPRDFGFCGVIPKPVGLADLRETLARLVAARS